MKTRTQVLKHLIQEQRKWIEDCERNGVSYADGERGFHIRRADEAELRRIETELKRVEVIA